jgi:hypothetical protein
LRETRDGHFSSLLLRDVTIKRNDFSINDYHNKRAIAYQTQRRPCGLSLFAQKRQ